MFYNYLSIALKQLRKQPVFSGIKIFSLTLGLACSMLVVMHVQYIGSANKHIANWENTYRLVTHMMVRETNTPYRTRATAEPYIPQLRLDYGDQIEYAAKIRAGNALFSRGNEASENDFYWAEPDAIPIFDLRFIQGDASGALIEPNTVILTESTARKYFGQDNPMGQTLTINNQADLRVIGVIADYPVAATTQMDMLISIPTGTGLYGENFMNNNGWIGFQGSEAYLTFPDQATAEQVSQDLPEFLERNLPEGAVTFSRQIGLGLSLQRLDDIYLNPLNNFGTVETSTSKTVLLGLVVFSILILATSCINYMNLSLAQLSQRNREIGVRKTLGASRRQIIAQFLVESLLLTVIALFIAIPLVAIALPTYTNLTETGFSFLDLFRTGFIAALVALVVVTGVVAGFIPAVSVSHLQPASIVKNANTTTRRGRLSKAAVTTAQFALSTALMLLAIAIYVQTNHLRELDVGYNRDNLVILDSRYSTINPEVFNYTALVNELEQHPGVLSVATSDFRPPGTGPINPWRIPRFAPDETITVAHTGVSPGFIETYEMELLAGRSFSEDFVSDFIPPQGIGGAEDSEGQVYGIVITDLLARRFGFDSPDAAIGQSFDLFDTNFRVIGVVKRFQFSSGMEAAERSIGILRSTVSPMRYLHLRLDPMQTEAALNHIDTVWERHQPSVPIERTFFAQTFDDIIADRTDGLSMAALMASVVTVLIAGFGLYALASYSSLRRTKEVGIRKALGATADSIVMLLAWDFIKPVLVACVIAWPIAWFAIEAFYAGFTSRAGFSVLIYGVVTGGVLAVALLTVAIQCFRTANSDPVKSLRYE